MSDTVKLGDNEFQVHKIGENYKDEGGIYAFMKISGRQWTIMYIGQTQSLQDRLTTNLKQHQSYGCAVINGQSTHLATRIVPDGERVRLDLERYLINSYNPPCNLQ